MAFRDLQGLRVAVGRNERGRAMNAERDGFVLPRSIEQASREISDLVGEIRRIEMQIPVVRDPVERSRLRYSLERRIARLHLVREWVANEKNRIRAGVVDGEPLDPEDPLSMLRRALFLLRSWAPFRPSIRDNEWAVINAIERYVMRR